MTEMISISKDILLDLEHRNEKLAQEISGYTRLQKSYHALTQEHEALRNLCLSYEATLASVPNIIMKVDNDKVYTWANQAGYDFFGPDVIGKEASFYFEGEQETYEIVQPVFKGYKEVIYVESRQRRQDGQVRLLAWWCRVLKDEHGEVKGVISSAQDITEIKKTETALRENSRFLQILLDSIPIPIFYKDIKGVYLGCNQKFCDFMRRTKEEITGKDVYGLLPKELADVYFKQDAELFVHPDIRIYETEIQRTNDSRYNVIFHKATFLNNDGSVGGLIGAMLDVTELKQTEKVLFDEALRRRILVEHSRDGIVVLDQNGKVFESNIKFAEMNGYSMEDVSHLHLHDFGYQLSPEKGIEMVRSDDEKGRHFETRNRRKDGKVYDVEISTNAAMIAGQKLIFCVCRDITERKQAEAALKASEAKFHDLVENAPIGIVTTLPDGGMLNANKAALDIFSYGTEEEFTRLSSLIHYVDANDRKRLLEIIREKGRAKDFEVQMKRQDGTPFWASITLIIQMTESGEIQYLSIIEDITEHKKIDQELRRSEEKLRVMFESLTEGLTIIDPDGVIVEVNAATIHLHGYASKEELIGQHAYELIIKKDRSRAALQIQKLLKEGYIRSEEYTFLKKDGKEFMAEMSASAIRDISGQPLGVVCIGKDITERKKEEAMKKLNAARLESLVKVSQFKAKSIQQLLDFALDEAIQLTLSKIGHIFLYDEDKKELNLNSWSREAMKECSIPNPITLYQLEKTGIWGEAVRQAKPIMVNDFQAPNPLKKGHPEGHVKLCKYLTLPIFFDGNIVAVVAVANKETDYDESDIRQLTLLMDSVWHIVLRKEAEESIIVSLKEKELLLKEVHHRVKNNMQIISSILSLQLGKVKDRDVIALLQDSQNRIQSMALVYNKLYQSQNLSSIDMMNYIQELTDGLIKSYANSCKVTTKLDINDISFGIDIAIPSGLVINELVTNSLKYAFPKNGTGQITISLKENDNRELELVVSDNGVGIPEGMNLQKTDTLGLKLVTNLVESQLDGKIELDRRQGTTFKITFRRNKEE